MDMKEEDVKRMQSVLYALAVKFLDRNQLMDVKEKIGMTILGQMLLRMERKKEWSGAKNKEYRDKMFKSLGV